MAISRRLRRRIQGTTCEVALCTHKAAALVVVEANGQATLAYLCRTHAREA